MASRSVKDPRAELQDYKQKLAEVTAELRLNPNDDRQKGIKSNLEYIISMMEKDLEGPSTPSTNGIANGASSPAQTAQRAAKAIPAAKSTVPTYKVNDKIQALWDHKFYNATIKSITGSSADPVYHVKYDGYPEPAKLGASQLKPRSAGAGQKRKLEEEPAVVMDTPKPKAITPTSSQIISADPKINAEALAAAQGAKDASTEQPTKRPKRDLPNRGHLNKNKNKWQNWLGSKVMATKEDSIFRTSDNTGLKNGSRSTTKKSAGAHRHKFVHGPEDD